MSPSPQPPSEGTPRRGGVRRYRVNVALLAALMLLLTLWFHRHLHLYVTRTLLVGGTLTLWALWKTLQSYLSWGVGEETGAWTRKALARPAATEALIFSLLILGALYATTSSVYLVYDGAPPGESSYRVELLYEGNPWLPTLEVSSYERVAGRPLFLRLRPVDLELQVTSPRGYRSRPLTLAPWQSLRIPVPRDLERVQYRLLRLIPGRGLLGAMPLPQAPGNSPYRLEVIPDGGGPLRVEGARFRTVWTGAEAEDLERLAPDAAAGPLRTEIEAYFVRLGVPAEHRGNLLTALEASPANLPSPAFRTGDSVRVILRRGGDGPPLVDRTVTVTDEPFQTLFLETSP